MNFRALSQTVTLFSFVIAGTLVACAPQGSYREVKVAQGGGELALEGDRALAHQKADDYMKSKCQAGYNVLEEGEVSVGTDTTTSQGSSSGVRAHGFSIGTRNQAKSSTRDATEWRVKYQCKDAAPAPAAAAPATAPAASLSSPTNQRVAEVQEVRVQF
jgi:hypothetical protein